MAPFRFSGWGSFKGQWHVSKDLKAARAKGMGIHNITFQEVSTSLGIDPPSHSLRWVRQSL